MHRQKSSQSLSRTDLVQKFEVETPSINIKEIIDLKQMVENQKNKIEQLQQLNELKDRELQQMRYINNAINEQCENQQEQILAFSNFVRKTSHLIYNNYDKLYGQIDVLK